MLLRTRDFSAARFGFYESANYRARVITGAVCRQISRFTRVFRRQHIAARFAWRVSKCRCVARQPYPTVTYTRRPVVRMTRSYGVTSRERCAALFLQRGRSACDSGGRSRVPDRWTQHRAVWGKNRRKPYAGARLSCRWNLFDFFFSASLSANDTTPVQSVDIHTHYRRGTKKKKN